MSASEDKYGFVERAKLAEQSERYEDMAKVNITINPPESRLTFRNWFITYLGFCLALVWSYHSIHTVYEGSGGDE